MLEGGESPASWRQAIISVIPKMGKDKRECSSYRPISILNMDYRLFTSIIAERLKNIIPEIIDEDQTGFLKNRQIQDSIRRALHLMDYMDKTQRESIALSLDAEKAFDSVRWDYLFLAMERFGFGDPFIQLIKNLYYLPSARIKINGSLTGVVDLQRGCRQGCPLSPALFALFIEPLAQAIREDEQIKGIWIRNTEYKTGLYADDILLTLTDPERSLPKLWLKMQMFGELSGYKINIQKSQSITYNYVPTTKIKSMSKFNWNNKIIKYLGIKIPKTLTEIYELNYSPITRELKENIQRWSLLPLDLYNRIDLTKSHTSQNLYRYIYQPNNLRYGTE